MAEEREEALYSRACCMPRIEIRDPLTYIGASLRERAKNLSEEIKRLKKHVVASILYSEVAHSDLESLLRPALTFRSRVAAERKDVDNYADHCGLGSSKGGNVGCWEYFDSFWDNFTLFGLWKRVTDYISSWKKLPKSKLEVTERNPHAGSESNTCEIQVDKPDSVYTAVSYSVKEDCKLQVTAHNLNSRAWEHFLFPCLQNPDPNLFKEFSISGDRGLLVANDSKSPDNAHLVVFNPSTGERKELPPLQFSRNPVVLHISVDAPTGNYKVIAAGSSSMASPFSRKVEVYDSRTSKWTSAADVPGPEFGLNEHQAGVCVGGILYFIAFLAGDGAGKGIVAFDIEKCEWVEEKSFPVPFAPESNILQLVECDGKVFLFSEQECDNTVMHCIDQVGGEELLKSVVKVNKTGGRGLLVYPEFTCVPFGPGKLCIFNALKRSGEVYDVGMGQKCEDLEAPEMEIDEPGENFFTLNPVSFALHPNLAIKP